MLNCIASVPACNRLGDRRTWCQQQIRATWRHSMPHVNKKLGYCRETKRYFVSFNISLDHSWQELVWFTGTQCQHGSRTYSIIWWLSKRGQQQSQSTTSHPIHHFTSFHIWLKLRYWLRLVFTLFFIKQMLPINNGCSTCRDRMLTRNVETVNRLCTRYNKTANIWAEFVQSSRVLGAALHIYFISLCYRLGVQHNNVMNM